VLDSANTELNIPVCSAQTPGWCVASCRCACSVGLRANGIEDPGAYSSPVRSLVQKTNRNGSRKEPRDENMSTCPGISVFDVVTGMYLHAAQSPASTALAVPAGECYTGAGRVPASVWQGMLWAVGSTRYHEMRLQHRVATRHAVSLRVRRVP